MRVYTLVSQYDIIQRSNELIQSSRILLDKNKKITPNATSTLAKIKEKQKLIAFLPSPSYVEVAKHMSQSDILSSIDVTCCLNWEDFAIALLKSPSLVLFHIDLVIRHNISLVEFISMMETLMKCMPNCTNTKLGLIITKETDISTIKVLKKSYVIGVCPDASDFGTKELDSAITQLINLYPYWPEHIISQLANSKSKLIDPTKFNLTPKQHDVLELIRTRGASNKLIARILGISESTVKIHVGAILKEYGLKNRIQLALSSKLSLKT